MTIREPMRRLCQPPLHPKFFSDGREVFAEIGEIFVAEIDVEIFWVELDAH